MKLAVVGSYKYIEEYAESVARYLSIDDYDATINITVRKELEDCYGFCWGDSDFIEIELARNVFNEKCDRKTILTTLAHEMVHAQQYITQKLRYCDDNFVMWKNRKYRPTNDEVNKPWELEAYRLQDIIYEHCQ